jgi:hypothetical protein
MYKSGAYRKLLSMRRAYSVTSDKFVVGRVSSVGGDCEEGKARRRENSG